MIEIELFEMCGWTVSLHVPIIYIPLPLVRHVQPKPPIQAPASIQQSSTVIPAKHSPWRVNDTLSCDIGTRDAVT